MSNGKDSDPIADAVEAVRKDAYAAGYKAALTAISNTVADMTSAAPESGAGYPPTKNVDGAPTVGTTQFYVWQAVLKKPGMTALELISVVKHDAPKASTGSIRTSLSRVKGKRLIVSRHGKWFPV
jgi:hypothetical protein